MKSFKDFAAANDNDTNHKKKAYHKARQELMAAKSDGEKEFLKRKINALKESSDDDIVTKFASHAHEEWRKGHEKRGGGPRIKKNSDGTEGDINVPFHKLHPDWKKENLAAGRAALNAHNKHPHDEEKAAEHVHNEWMKRNPKEEWNKHQHKPYKDLPEEEKEKDREHVRTIKRLKGVT